MKMEDLNQFFRARDVLFFITTFFIGLIGYRFSKHVSTVKKLPPGPFPLPILGNLLSFFVSKPNDLLLYYRHRYGDIFTVWLGQKPSVFVSSWVLAKEALITKKNDFSGRPKMLITEVVMPCGNDVLMTDYGEEWEVLRRVFHNALRNFTLSEKLAHLVYQVVDEVTDDMIEEGNIQTRDYVYLIIYNIIATSAFNNRYDKLNPDFILLKENNEKFHQLIAKGFPPDFIPILRPFFRKTERALAEVTAETQEYIMAKLKEHKKTYKKGRIRDFTDAVLFSRQDAQEKESSSKQYLGDNNLNMVIGDLFAAGSDTSQGTLRWLILFLARFQAVQEKIALEIKHQIGDRMAVQDDKLKCHYTRATISEILRIRTPLPLGMPHKTICDTVIGGQKIPAETTVFFQIDAIQTDPVNWDDPEGFKPERFLDKNGFYTLNQVEHYLPFGLGSRGCIGQTMARNNLFLILVRLLQKCRLEMLDKSYELDLTPADNAIVCEPKDHFISVTRRAS